MEFFSGDGDYRDIGEVWAKYQAYLETIRHKIPAEAYDFAVASWHYDPADHRSLHDAWVEKVLVSEEVAPGNQTPRKLRIDVRLVGSYHDGHHELSYAGVRAYQLDLFGRTASPESRASQQGHGDWLVDEIRLSPSGSLVHEIVFSSGARWIVECDSIKHSTTTPPLRG